MEEPRVHLPQGTLQGKVMLSRKERQIFAYQGIPYAAPPLGKLRFQSAGEAPKWSGVRLAHKEGNDCTQKHFFKGEFVGSEDCLYLNVYTPAKPKSGKNLAVMVWIHGGGFFASSGSTEMYGPEFLLDHDVVLVTINYRLGTLGFFNLGSAEASGNFGLKDQVAALRWVKDNISNFGGDPNLVTIFGESAGGASIHYLLISPLAKGLFHRAIAQSGSAFNPWAFRSTEEAKLLSLEICNQLSCRDDLDSLKQVEANKLAEEGKKLKLKYKLKAELVPSLETENSKDAFLTENPRLLEVVDVPLMIGVTTHEGIMELDGIKDVEQHLRENYFEFVPWKELGIGKESEKCREIWRQIDDFYEKTYKGDKIEKFIQINSDVDFICGVDDLVQATVSNEKRTQPLFYYQFSFDGNLGFFKKKANIERAGACHTDELSYLFTREITPWRETASEQDFKTIDRLTKLWTDFAKFGNPTPDTGLGVEWKPVVKKDDNLVTQFLEIGQNLEMHTTCMNGERMQFWRNLVLKNKV